MAEGLAGKPKRWGTLALVVVCCLAAASCAKRQERVLFDGNFYPTKSKADKSDRANFVVTVRRVSRGIDGARMAGGHEGTRYCIENFGTSVIEWTQGPDAEDGTLQMSGGNLVLRGRCITW